MVKWLRNHLKFLLHFLIHVYPLYFLSVDIDITVVTGGRNTFDSCNAMSSMREGGGGRETGMDVVVSAKN